MADAAAFKGGADLVAVAAPEDAVVSGDVQTSLRKWETAIKVFMR